MARSGNTVYGGYSIRDGSRLTYYIKNNSTGLFYVWCYTNLADAHAVADRVKPDETNWRSKRSDCAIWTRDNT